jgi:formylglycine-generating enzyme required for sulfatase activity/tRNA A-37 threonylcarbamoyl transferase component Bud32
MTDDIHTLESGSTFGKHRIVRLLGRGGMGEVYEVLDGEGLSWALKVLAEDMMDKPGAVERFRKEARVTSEMDHPGIVKVDLTGETDGRHWLRMEMAEGREVGGEKAITLQEYLEANDGRLSEVETKDLLRSLLTSLEYAHGRGLVHRDLKPANVLFFGDEPKIADFGLVDAAGAEWMETQVKNSMVASMMEETLPDADAGPTGSRSKALMGTFAYMSPEQKEGREADARSDLYAIGLMAREAITGVKSLGMERPTEMAHDIHAGWDDWVRRAVANDAERRFQSAGAMRSGLTFPKAKRSSSPMPLLLLGLAAVFAAVYFVIGNPFVGKEESTQDKETTEEDLAGLEAGASGLRLTIDPPGVSAKVWIAGQAGREGVIGKKFFEDLEPGDQDLIVRASGYETYSTSLRLEEGWNKHRVGLVALRGGLVVLSDPGVEVVAIGSNGREVELGVTDRLGELVSQGILAVDSYRVFLSKPMRVSVSRNVQLTKGKAVTLDEALDAVPGKLSVTASPAGVVIHLDGVSKGAVPLELSGVPAEKDLEVTARLEGYRELRRTIRLEAAGSQTIDFGSLVEDWGNLVVKFRADLAENPATKMFLDDADVTAKVKRDTPGAFALEELSVGSRVVKITHPDFLPWTGSIAVRDAETTASEAMLKPKDAELRLEVRSENPEVGQLKGFSVFDAGTKLLPEGGSYRLPAEKEIVLQVKADGHRSHTETLSFTAKEKCLLKIELKGPIKYIVSTDPEGALATIGKSSGRTPLSFTFLEEGSYPLKIVKPGFHTIDETIVVRGFSPQEKKFQLKRKTLSRPPVIKEQPKPISSAIHPPEGTHKPKDPAKPSKEKGVSPALGKNFTFGAVPIRMVWVQAGDFTMGSPVGEPSRDSDESQHLVRIRQGFWLGESEVTQAQWGYFMGENINPSKNKRADFPVESVSWANAAKFCLTLTEAEKAMGRLPIGMSYQLPTEAQWEYACRAGTVTTYSFGRKLNEFNANVSGESTQRINSYKPNAWGFYDMHGNVSEWCADWYGKYPVEASDDPLGSVSSSNSAFRVHRGGSWRFTPVQSRSARRQRNGSSYSAVGLGFRLSLRPVGK